MARGVRSEFRCLRARSAACHSALRAPHSGFTLLEIMVVVVIIGIMAAFASIKLSGRAAADRVDEEARRLFQVLVLAQEEAQMKGREIGFRYTDAGYEFLGMGDDGNWQILEEPRPFRARGVEPPLRLELRIEGRVVPPAIDSEDKEKKIEPQFMLLSSGELAPYPFQLDLKAEGVPGFYRVEAKDILGKIEQSHVEDKK
ncbi:MAG TPA: type II secretion system minor pseudopilin GspH [Solimonas sp.]|nr:type II secretion system minor pseudopilin GspH [Solimonas sp.]